MKQLRYRLEYAIYLFFSLCVQNLSRQSVRRLGRLIGAGGYHLAKKRNRIAEINLNIAFGESKSADQKKRIIKNSFTQLVVSALQLLWAGHCPKERVFELIDHEPEGLDVLRHCLERKKGVFFLTAHYGNWEVMGIYHGYMGISPLYSIARALDNPYLEKIAMKLRTISGNGIFYKEQSPLKIVRTLKNNCCVAVMMDQNMARGGIFVDFFGKKTATARSIAVLSYSTGAPILPLFCYPLPNGKYKIKYGPELLLEKTGDKETDILNWTQVCEKYLESVIREFPDPWMWGHRRWKTRPPEEKGVKVY
jgi:KDO2-lipid IV(A) lauroyltransferase